MGLGAPPGRQPVPPNPRLALPPSPAGRGQGLVTHGSGECMGEEAWRMYWVHWNTRKARLARKSRADSRPATGRSWKPVRSAGAGRGGGGQGQGGGGGGGGRARAADPGTLRRHRTLQEAGDILQLRDSVLAVPTEALQQLEGLQVLAAGVGGVQAPQRGVDLLPAGQGLRPAPAPDPPCIQSAPTPWALLCPRQAPAASHCRLLTSPRSRPLGAALGDFWGAPGSPSSPRT